MQIDKEEMLCTLALGALDGTGFTIAKIAIMAGVAYVSTQDSGTNEE